MPTYYNGNEADVTSKDLLSNEILVKTTKQEIESKIFEGIFGIFTRPVLDTGKQWEEIEVANLESEDFDAEGSNPLTKKQLSAKTLYHKINRRRTFKTTVSDAQVKMSMLSVANMASLASAIVNELYNSSAIEDFEAMKELLKDILEEKKITICDMNGKGSDMDSLTKAIQTIATNMTLPSTKYNFSGFKKAFNKKEDLVLIIDSVTQAKLNVDSLASAFNMSKKDLVSNIIVIDEMPSIELAGETATKQIELAIGKEGETIAIYKASEGGEASVTGKVIAFLVDKKALVRDPVERELTEQYNAKGRFTNYYYHVTDVLSYSTLKNAIVFVD